MEIIEKKEHPLLSRTEIIAKDSYTGATPSRGSIKERLVNALKANKELLIIKHIYPEFGFSNAKIIAYLYSNKKDMERIEPEYAFKKGIPKENKEEKKAEDKKNPEEKKEEEKKQNKPETEEKKEEVKPEQEKEKPAEQEKQDKGKPEEKKPEQKENKPETKG